MIQRSAKRCLAVTASAALLLTQQPAAWLWAAEQAMLEGVEVQPNQVVLHLNQKVSYNPILTREPPRLVIELLNTEHAAPAQTQAGDGDILKRVRSGQYQKEPSLISRVVLDLKRMSSYQTKWDGNRLLVSLVGGGSPAQPEAVQPKPAAAQPKPVAAQPKPAAPVVAKAVERDAVAELPDNESSENSSMLGQIARSGDAEPSPEEAVEPVQPAPRPRAAAPEQRRRVKRDIMASLPTEPVSLDYDSTDIRDILKLMGMKARVNIVYGADVAGAVTLHLQDVPFNEAFTTVLSMSGLVANQAGQNILRVMTPTAAKKERDSSTSINQTRVIKLKYVKADEVRVAIESVRKAEGRGGVITVDANTNSLIVTDTLEAFSSVERLLAEIDVRPQQVLIEAKLVEVYLSKGLNLGIQWDYLSIDGGKIAGQQGLNMMGTATNPLGAAYGKPMDQNASAAVGAGANGRGTGVYLPATSVAGAFTFGRVTNNYFLSATLTAAASQGKAKVLSDPKITTLNGKTANINITTSIPYVTTDTTPSGGTVTTAQKVSFQQTGITLNVTPIINADGRISMVINPTVSQPSNTPAAAGTTGAIATDSRTAQTEVIVQDGGTVVIGGLITDSVSDTVRKVPLLGDIPLIGWLFKSKTATRTRVELLIFVTAKIIPT